MTGPAGAAVTASTHREDGRSAGYSLGVDLGTTFVAAAISRNSQPEMFTLCDRSMVSPSVVYLREDGVIVTSEAADRRASSSPDRVARGFKRRLGDPMPVILGGQPHSVLQLLGALLRDVLARVTETEGAPPDHVVLTHPANWGPFRRALFEEVPLMVGLRHSRMITEPEAAAAYYASTRRLDEGEIVAVYDLGGGTFDVTILRKRATGIEILGVPEGIERLGGIDFDDAVMNYVNHAANGALDELDQRDPAIIGALGRLRQDCVLAKETLSIDDEVVVPLMLPERHLEVRLTRADFEELVRAQVESTIGALSRTLRSAQITPADLTAVLLVGGSSRIPLVARMVSEELGRPTVVDTHPKYAVALGAASLADVADGPADRGPAFPGVPVTSGPRSPLPVTPADPADAQPPITQPPIAHPAIAHPAVTHPPAALAETAISPTDISPTAPAVHTAAAHIPAIEAGDAVARPSRVRPAIIAAAVALVIALGVGTVLYLNKAAPAATPEAASAAAPAAPAPAPAPAPGPAPAEPAAATPAVATPVVTAAITVGSRPASVTFAPDGRHAFVMNYAQETGLVSVVDTANHTTSIKIAVNPGTGRAVFTPDGRFASVTNFAEAGVVSVIDTATNKVTATIAVPPKPNGLDITPDGRKIYLASSTPGVVSVIDTGSNKVTASIPVNKNPDGVAITPDGRRAYVTNYGSDSVSVIDTASNKVTETVRVENQPVKVAIAPDGRHAYVTNRSSDTVSVIDTATNKVVFTVPVGRNPSGVAVTPDGRHAYVTNRASGTVTVIDTNTNAVTHTLPVGAAPVDVAISPDGHNVYITNRDSGTVAVIYTGLPGR
ncbi:MAG TPA: Hsp70 family protein [Pseudonocardia sp.]|uniref:Hsp70 family protein n=1 Tax=Pseudonocardia sp. TaxID=60912 RepID=UPI002C23A2B3|nr:Hsp70 family protein [Pseudonocardia sp.]HTF51491.1 Hsp70 family protein [Pseudonocardia sp.]